MNTRVDDMPNTSGLTQLVAELKAKARADLTSSVEQRKQRIQQVIDMLVDEKQSLVEAIEADYQGRCQPFSTMTDILGCLASLKYTRDNLYKWVEPRDKEMIAPYDQMGAKAYTMAQPKGVIGILGTWNYPLFTVLSPLACVLGAGNRAVLKVSVATPRTAQALAAAVKKHLDSDVVEVVTGDSQVSREFTSQAWDHLVFTGGIETGKKIMASAAQNLVPVTLELGGKSPAIISQSADIKEAARRLAIAKGTNSGQICVCPDTVYVPESARQEFIDAFMSSYQQLYPTVTNNGDVVPVINDANVDRIQAYISELNDMNVAIYHSHDVVEYNDKRLPMTIAVNPPADAKVSQEEIFGPMLVLNTYNTIEQVVSTLQQQAKPLALYYYGDDAMEKQYVLLNTTSGGVTVNDAMLHPALHDAPFGGVGESGIGHYHGEDGFWEFSHKRTVFEAPAYDFRADYGLLPPYNDNFAAMMDAQVSKD
ncbi:aldehyde dehydrogenase family protein [Thalassotalea ponticola]|uniref:aldehyde dehydrogenase family protein n=1 Tax=Thalassotalea ponticola TaxID=1523392 RepID=UPI0025B6298A|nr:aldehyde dehydrogenase family protein [Thalassotalea ponticola]MDN3653810.1 aldehyde dehydrogenase family protein [Thalassotalea ponticola]